MSLLAIFIGLLVLLAVMIIGRWFSAAPPAAIVRTVRWTGGGLLLGLVLLLALSGRLGWALAAVAGLSPWLMRAIHLHTVFRTLQGRFGAAAGVRAAAGGGSRIETRFLRMVLDHDSGLLSGHVLAGPSAGRSLSQLSFVEAMELYHFCAADPQSVQLLEAWLDRTWTDWRKTAAPHQEADGGGQMTRQEAWDILGLAPDATPAMIKEAHRRLMIRLHPDHGGSNYLAAKINQAKDLLLRG